MNKFIFKKEKIIKFSTETNKQKTNRALKSWCTGTTLRDGMGKEVEGGFRTGDTCTSMADSCQCMAKTTTVL